MVGPEYTGCSLTWYSDFSVGRPFQQMCVPFVTSCYTSLYQAHWMTKVVAAIQQGDSVIVENIPQDIDAALNPVLQVIAQSIVPYSYTVNRLWSVLS